MTDTNVKAYEDMLRGQLLRAKEELARAESAVKKIELKLENSARALAKELKRGGVKATKVTGGVVPAPKVRKAEIQEPQPKEAPKKKGFFDDIV